jgi:hypothetical protein
MSRKKTTRKVSTGPHTPLPKLFSATKELGPPVDRSSRFDGGPNQDRAAHPTLPSVSGFSRFEYKKQIHPSLPESIARVRATFWAPVLFFSYLCKVYNDQVLKSLEKFVKWQLRQGNRALQVGFRAVNNIQMFLGETKFEPRYPKTPDLNLNIVASRPPPALQYIACEKRKSRFDRAEYIIQHLRVMYPGGHQ